MIKFLSILSLVLVLSFNTIQAQHFDKPHAHQVKEGETIESIAKRYYVTPLDIYSLNPDAKDGLKENTIIIIPESNLPEQKKTEVKELRGFKEHKTKRKETLYSLTKKYNVLEEDIKKYNKFLYSNQLRKNDKLQIPIFKITEVVEALNTNKTYTVLPKEGKWRVAYKFGITVKELEAINPEMGEVLQAGQEINVPNIDTTEVKELDEKYSYYKVLPKEGFYRLKLKLGIEQDELETLNPILKESGLKEAMILKIPYNETIGGVVSEHLVDVNLVDSISDFSTKHIAFMLPFKLNRVDFDSVPETKESINKDPYLRASLDFHSGVLLAINHLKNLGISLKVDVYDTENQVSKVTQIIKDNDFETVDAVIGPLIAKNFQKAATDLRSFNVPVISPIGNNIKLHDNVFQSKPSDELLKRKIISFVKSDSLVNNVVIIADMKHTAIANDLKGEFNSSTIIYSRKNKKGEDENYVLFDDIKRVLKPGKNIVFLETKNEGFASNVTSVLNSLLPTDGVNKTQKRTVVLVTTDKNTAFEGDEISNAHLSNLQFHFATSSKMYNENDDNSFIKEYTEHYKVTPNKRAVLGYDLTMDTVLRLVTSSDLYMSVNETRLTEYVENKFAYKKKPFGGYYNDTVYLVKYDDLNIVEVEQ